MLNGFLFAHVLETAHISTSHGDSRAGWPILIRSEDTKLESVAVESFPAKRFVKAQLREISGSREVIAYVLSRLARKNNSNIHEGSSYVVSSAGRAGELLRGLI
jgi:hypothetical protein